MKRHVLIFAAMSVLLSFFGCDTNERLEMDSPYAGDYDINYGIRQVMQYDEVNINGIDLAARFPFFETFRLTIHYTDSKISGVTFSNGEVPFSPYDFEIPAGKIACFLDTSVLPHALRTVDSGHVIAYYQNGEFSVPFKLDCPALDYKYTFKSVDQ